MSNEFWIGLGLGLIGGATLCAFIIWLMQRGQKPALLAEQTRLIEAQHSLEQTQLALQSLKEHHAAQEARLEAAQQNHQAQLALQKTQFEQTLAQTLETLQGGLKTHLLEQLQATQKTLGEQSEALSETQRKQLLQAFEPLVKPLNEAVSAYQHEVRKFNEVRLQEQGSVLTHLSQLKQVAQGLAGALSHNKGRGNWGELELRRLLEDSGLTEGVSYEFQPQIENRRRPDFKLNLSDGRVMFIDAKALQVLDNTEAQNALATTDYESDSISERQKRAATSLKSAIDGLSSKAYQAELGKSTEASATYVVLYVPREAMLAYALEYNPGLFEYAYSKNIILAGPFNLMGLLKLVHHGWRQLELSQNAKKVEEIGRAIHRESVEYLDRMLKLDAAINALRTHYDNAMTALNGRGKLTHKLQQMETLGCKSDKSLPEKLPENLSGWQTAAQNPTEADAPALNASDSIYAHIAAEAVR
ncbi:MAG: DNA recombination protein RmuC [Vampirovibrionales bacterium]|nr:DNA recombination protein RmuC [Vampirovibrionales bacterium]